MSDQARLDARITLNDAMAFVASQGKTRSITNQTFSEFIDEALKQIEGEILEDGTKIRPGQLEVIEKLRASVGQLTEAVARTPEVLESDVKSDAGDDGLLREQTLEKDKRA